MSEPNDNFGWELVEVSAQLHELAIVARTMGITKTPACRALLVQIKLLVEEMPAMINTHPSQAEVDEMTERCRALLPQLLAVVKTQGASPQ